MKTQTMNRWVLGFGVALSIFVLGLSQLPWWTLAFPASIAGLFYTRAKNAFIEIFIAAFAVWFLVAFAQDVSSGFRISPRIAGIFHLPLGSLAYVVTGSVAGLVAGCAALIGQIVRYIPGGK